MLRPALAPQSQVSAKNGEGRCSNNRKQLNQHWMRILSSGHFKNAQQNAKKRGKTAIQQFIVSRKRCRCKACKNTASEAGNDHHQGKEAVTVEYLTRFMSCRENHRSEEHTSELQSLRHLVCRLLLE